MMRSCRRGFCVGADVVHLISPWLADVQIGRFWEEESVLRCIEKHSFRCHVHLHRVADGEVNLGLAPNPGQAVISRGDSFRRLQTGGRFYLYEKRGVRRGSARPRPTASSSASSRLSSTSISTAMRSVTELPSPPLSTATRPSTTTSARTRRSPSALRSRPGGTSTVPPVRIFSPRKLSHFLDTGHRSSA